MPFPIRKTLASRLGVHPRQVTRVLNNLQAAGFLKKIDRRGAVGEQRSNFYDLTGTIEKMRSLERDYTEMREKARANRQTVEISLSRRTVKPR